MRLPVWSLLPCLALLFTALVIGGSCKTRGFQTSSLRKPEDRGAYARWVKAQDSLVPVQETVISEGMSTSDAQAYRTKRTTYQPRAAFEQRAGVVDIRPELVALSQTDGLRDLLVSSVIAEQRRRSNALKKALLESRRTSGALSFDTIIIGAGPHGAALAQVFTDEDPNRSVLIIDGASRPGGTFAEVGPVFALNSTNRQDTGAQANVGRGQRGGPKGDGNLNAVADLLGIPDFSGLKWPLAGDLGYVATMATEYSSSHLLLNTRVTALGSDDPDSAYVVVEDTGSPNVLPVGGGFQIRARRVILATGIGKPSFFLPAKESLRMRLAEETPSSQPPPIMGFGEFVSRVNNDLRELRDPMAPYVKKRILVVGAGDSGKVVLEWLAGLGPDSRSYGAAQEGEPQEIVWAGVDFFTCKEFLQGARARYSRLAQPINSALIALAPYRVTSIDPVGPKTLTISGFELKRDDQNTFGPEDLSDSDRAEIERLESASRPFTTRSISVGELRNKEQTNPDGTLNLQIRDISLPNQAFDYVIDATGFRTETLALLQRGFGKSKFPEGAPLSTFFQPVSGLLQEGANSQLRGTSRRFVAQLKDPTSSLKPALPIFLVGPANEQVAALVDSDETANVSANTVSLFANIIRTKRFATEIVRAFPSQNPVDLDLSRGTTKTIRPVVELQNSRAAAGGNDSGGVSAQISLDLREIAQSEGSYKSVPTNQDLEIGLRKILSSLDLRGVDDNFKIWIFLDERNEKKATATARTVTLAVMPGFNDQEDRNLFEGAILQDVPFQDLLFKFFAPDGVAVPSSQTPTTFVEAASKIIVVESWSVGSELGTAGGLEAVASVRVQSRATRKELLQQTGIDLNPAPTPKRRDQNNILDNQFFRVKSGTLPLLTCGVFVPSAVPNNGSTPLFAVTEESVLASRRRPLLIAFRRSEGTKVEGALYPATNVLTIESGSLEQIRAKVSRVIDPNFNIFDSEVSTVPAFPLSIPVKAGDTDLDFGDVIYDYYGIRKFQFADNVIFKGILDGLSDAGAQSADAKTPVNNLLTISPTEEPDVWEFVGSQTLFRLVCPSTRSS